MAVQIHDHIHLGTTTPPTATTYTVSHGSLDNTPGVAMYFERSFTGKLQVHRLLSGAEPVTFQVDKVRLKCTLAEMLAIRALAGKQCYYVPNYHDDVASVPQADYIYTCFISMPPGSITNLDPMSTWWWVNLSIVDDEIA